MGLKIAIIICSQNNRKSLNELTLTQSLAIASLYPFPCLWLWLAEHYHCHSSLTLAFPQPLPFTAQTISCLLFIGNQCPKGSSTHLNQTQHLDSRAYPKLHILGELNFPTL